MVGLDRKNEEVTRNAMNIIQTPFSL